MGRIYTAAGWVNWDYIMNQQESIISVVGARGTGKTYGIFKWLIEHEQKFIYVRRLKSQLEECRKDAGNPFKKLNIDMGINIRPFTQAGSISFNYEEKQGKTAAVGVALSVVANIRGVDFSDYDYIVFDEFISSEGERPIKNEFQAFLNFYETVNRNSELEGKEAEEVINLLLISDMYTGCPWNKAIKRSFIEEHHIRFVPKMISEDTDWFLQVVVRAKTYTAINEAFLVYRQREGSTSHAPKIKSLTDNLHILESWPKRFNECGLSKGLKRALTSVLARYYANMLVLYTRFPSKETKR